MNHEITALYNTSLAIEILARLGNWEPSQDQIDLMESLLTKFTVIQDVLFNPKLTNREIVCLYLAALGKTSVQTGKLLNIQPGTVEQHRKGVKKKLSSKSMAEAVFKGIYSGYVKFCVTCFKKEIQDRK